MSHKSSDVSFIKKGRRGPVTVVRKHVREHYVRDDIPLWHEDRPLPDAILIPDPVVCANQLDMLSRVPSGVAVIVLQSVLSSLRLAGKQRAYRQIKEQAQESPQFFHFANEHCRTTYISSAGLERHIVRACHHYIHVFPTATLTILTNSASLVVEAAKAEPFPLESVSASEWVSRMEGERGDEAAGLADLLSSVVLDNQNDVGAAGEKRVPLFEAHMEVGRARDAVEAGRLSMGEVTVQLAGDEAWVDLRGKGPDVLVVGRDLNRAIHGDTVAIRIHDRSKWRRVLAFGDADGADDVEDEGGGDDTDEPLQPQTNTDVQAMDGAQDATIPTGKVVAILERSKERHCCTMRPRAALYGHTNSGEAARLVVPMDRRIPKIRIRTRQADNLEGSKLVCHIDGWSRFSRYPDGHYVERLGDAGDGAVEAEALMRENGIVTQPFSNAALACLPPPPHVVSSEQMEGRRDLRSLCVASIDPPGCVDIDDALHARVVRNSDDEVEVGVHIADVTAYVDAASALDREAARRGCTVYLVDRRVNMLPPVLGENLCSLHEGVDRLAFSVIWRMRLDEQGGLQILSTDFQRTVIKSRRAMTYAAAQAILDNRDGGQADPDVASAVKLLARVAERLRTRRLVDGALTLASSEVKFEMDTVTNRPSKMRDDHDDGAEQSHQLVEEFMLLANRTVARHILDEFPACAVLRRHPPPDMDRFANLQECLAGRGLTIDATSSKSLALSLDRIASEGSTQVDRVVRQLATRCMQQAHYFCAGELPQSQHGHYGLAIPHYTHFTSPIRRYADVQVHRLLAACIDRDYVLPAHLTDAPQTSALCKQINSSYANAQRAGRASVELSVLMYLTDHPSDLQGHITSLRANGFRVLIEQFGIEGIVYLSKADEPCPYTLSPDGMCLVANQMAGAMDISSGPSRVGGKPRRTRFEVMDRVAVHVSVEKERMRMELLD